jgi:hypothetical protein
MIGGLVSFRTGDVELEAKAIRALIHEFAMLLPSPIHAYFLSSIEPRCWRTVSRSASTGRDAPDR